jgi:hypothetical protein
MNDADTKSIVANMAASLAPQDQELFRAAAVAAVASMPADMRGPGSMHRTIEAEWRRYFRPPEGNTGELLATRYRARRRATLTG